MSLTPSAPIGTNPSALKGRLIINSRGDNRTQDPVRTYSHPGLAVFAGVLAGIMGTMNLFFGFLLLVNAEFLVLANEGLFYVDATAWG